MGGCTSKPKVLKGDEAEALAPAPQKVEEEKEAVKAAATAAVVVVVEGDVKKDQDGAAADDNDNKSRSLGSLFKESQEGKDSSESETVKDFVVSEVKQTEPETTREVQPKEVKQTEEQVVVSLVDGLAKEVNPTEEAAPMVDVPANEVQSQGVKPTVKGECAEKTYKEPEEKSETLEEKKQEESATATEQEKAEK